MRPNLLLGLLAGAAGTIALDAVTYADMLVRGRPPSRLPAEAARRTARSAGVPLGEGERADNRSEALGALLGYATGLTVGVGYGVARRWRSDLPVLPAGVLLGLAAMAVSDVPLTASGLTDPRGWGVEGWLADLVPHLAYGLAAAGAYELVDSAGRSR
jgi:hypothetical protein